MRTVSIRFADMGKTIIPVGFVGENVYTHIVIDCKKIFEEFPAAIASLAVNSPHGEKYPAIVTRDGDFVIWAVKDSDLVYEGDGEIQLSFIVDEIVAKSGINRICIKKSITANGESPDPIEDWIADANEKLGEVDQAIDMIEDMTVEAETLSPDASATATITDVDGHKNIAFGIPKGDAGQDGRDGQDGHSPVVTASKTGKVTTVSVDGEPIAEIDDGEDGQDGQDGHSPVVTASKSGKVTTVSVDGTAIATINDGNDGQDGQDGVTPNVTAGTTTTGSAGTSASVTRRAGSPDSAPVFDFTIPKGDKGDPGNATIDDTAGAGDTDKVWSADKSSQLKSALSLEVKRNTIGYNILTKISFEQGDYSNGTKTDSGRAIRYPVPITILNGDKLKTKASDVLYLGWQLIDENGDVVETGYQYTTYKVKMTTSEHTFTHDGLLYIAVANGVNSGNSSAISPSDFEDGKIEIYNDYAWRVEQLLPGIESDISGLRSAVTNVVADGYLQNTFAWQRGGLSSGQITEQSYRIVTTDLQTAASDIVIKNTNTLYKFGIYYTSNGTGVDTGWITSVDGYVYKVPSGATYRITVAKVSENYIALTDAEVLSMSQAILISTNLRDAYIDIDLNESASLYGTRGFDPTDFIIGVYYPSGSYSMDTARVCTKNKISFPFDTKIGVKTGYRIGANLYDSEGAVIKNIGFGTTEIFIPKNTDFNLNIDNGNTSATANIQLYASQVFYLTNIKMDIENLQSIGTYSYSGVNVKPKTHGFNTEQLPWSYSAPTTSGTYTPQAMSYSNGVVFKCWNNDLIQLYNFSTGEKIAEYTLTSAHGDCMDFSNEYYSGTDEFPLAYFTSDISPLEVYVNRLTRTGATLIRTLKFTIESAGYYAGHAVDAVNNRLITLGYTENSFETNANGTNYMKCAVWDLNNLTANGDGTYVPALLKSFTLPFIICTQDQCYYNNKFFVISSNWQNTSTVIYVIDIGEQSVVSTFSDIPYKTYETEGIFWVNSDMYVNGNGITKYMFV